MSFYQVNRPRRRTRPPLDINARSIRPIAICDGCGFEVNRDTLVPHMQYRGGAVPVPDGTLVCPVCDDVPQPYYKKQVLPPDPVPVKNPRPDAPTAAGSYPTYASVADLPAADTVPAGYPVDVTISGSTVRCYADTINWRRYDSDEVVS